MRKKSKMKLKSTFRKLFLISIIFLTIFNKAALAFENDTPKKLTKNTITIDEIDPAEFTQKAVLQVLNKITARTEKLTITVGRKNHFGKLDILIHKCWKSPLFENPDSKILLEIFQKRGESKEGERIFYGWMIASSPSISGLEHPIYDITALECIN